MAENAATMFAGAKSELEKKYIVRISAAALDLVVRGIESFGTNLFPDDETPQKCVRILDEACRMAEERIRNCDDEIIEFNDEAHRLDRALVELVELYRDNNSSATRSWVDRLRSERDSTSFHMREFFVRWDFSGSSPIFFPEETRKFRLFMDDVSSFKWTETNLTSQGVAAAVDKFLFDIRRILLARFARLLEVKACDVAEVISRHTDVPLTQILESDNDRKKRAVYMTNQRVVNQERVVDEIYEVLSSERPIITKRPRGSFLLVGPTGVGKREIAKAVALHWYCDANRIVEIDISEYADLLPMKSAVPPPYDFLPFGSESKEKHLLDRLTQVVAKRPYSVILLSKIDNDPLTVTRVLLRILSDGDNALSSNTKGNVVDFSQCIIFLTSNVGPDQLVSSCYTCYKNHDCSYLKDSVEMTKFIDEFKILVVERFDDEKAVARVLLRELVTEAYGNGCIVHASDAALDALLIIAHKPRLGEGGNAIKQTLIKHVMSKVAVANELDKKVVLCVDTWVGSRKLSFRIYSPEQSVADRYFKFKAGTADEYIAHLKKTVGALDKVFHLRRRFLDLSESGECLSSLRELVIEAFRALLASYSPCGPPLICAFKQIEESCHRLPTTEDKRKLESVIRSLQSLETSTGKVTSSIIDVLLKTGDSQLEMPSLQRRNYMFGGLNHGAKTKLIECLTQSLGESFFTYIKLHDNYRGGEKEKASLMGKVNKNPCMVVFVDGVEFADDIFYKSLLDIFDNGVLEDCEGFGVEFRRSIIILTSELLANTPRNTAAVYFKDRRNDVSIQPFNQEEDVFKEESFRTELLHRLDEIVFFDPEGGNASFMPISAAAHSHYVDNYHFSLLSSPMQLSSPFESSSMQQHSRL